MGIVQLLVEKKGDVTAKNTAGATPLHTACNNGHVSIYPLDVNESNVLVQTLLSFP